jgi:hypothetical protein
MTKRKQTRIELAMTDDSKSFNKTGADFDELMKEVEGYVFADVKNYRAALEYLRDSVRLAIYQYFVDRWVTGQIFWSEVHKLRDLATRMIEILQNEESRIQIFFALDQIPEFYKLSGCPGKDGYVDGRYEGLLTELKKLSVASPLPLQKRRRQRPARTDLRALLERLANEWRIATNKPFERNWHKGLPLTPAMQFVYAVVKFADPDSLAALPKMTEKIIAEARHTRSDNSLPWLE